MHPTVSEDCGDGGMTWAMAVGLAKLLGPRIIQSCRDQSFRKRLERCEDTGQSTLDFGFLSLAPRREEAPPTARFGVLGGLGASEPQALGQASWLCCWPREAGKRCSVCFGSWPEKPGHEVVATDGADCVLANLRKNTAEQSRSLDSSRLFPVGFGESKSCWRGAVG